MKKSDINFKNLNETLKNSNLFEFFLVSKINVTRYNIRN